jgi:hypothetical protein
VTAPNPIATSDWVSPNFYADLAEVWGSYDVHDLSGDDSPTTDSLDVFQLVPKLGPVGDAVKFSKSRTKRMTKYIITDGKRRCG